MNKMWVNSIGAFLFSSVSLLAQADDIQREAVCQTIPASAIERMASMPQGRYAAWWPEFFEDRSQGTRKLYAGIMCSSSIHRIENGSNCIVDLATGQISPAPGFFDGQWVKDPNNEPIFTIPNKYQQPREVALPGLTFYRYSDVLTRGKAAPTLFRDPSFGNHYHSFGKVSEGREANGSRFAIHRAMNDKWGVSIKDYKFRLSDRGDVLGVEMLGAERNLTNGPGETELIRTAPANTADPNPHNSYFDLPMISQDGRFFGANNRKTMTTQIFEIEANGKRLVADLGFETGKVSFAPQASGSNDLYLAFHVDQIDPAEGDKMTGVHPGMTKDVMVMRLAGRLGADGKVIYDPGQMIRITSSDRLGDGNYYPKWVNEKELLYIESRNNNRQSFVKVNVDQLPFRKNILPRPDSSVSATQYAATAALGVYYTSTCTNFSRRLTAKESAMYAVNLDASTCERIAKAWDSWKGMVPASTELFALRAPKAPGSQRVSGYNFHESSSRRGAERFERALAQQDVSALTASDLQAVCDLLKR